MAKVKINNKSVPKYPFVSGMVRHVRLVMGD
jgi:hypothetical protein